VLHRDVGTVNVRGVKGGMCGKTGKVFYKMGNLGCRSSTWCLGSGSVFGNRRSFLIVTAECVGVNVCINSFLIMYCECVLLLKALHPFTDRKPKIMCAVERNM